MASTSAKNNSIQDKQIIEVLIKRLSDLIQKDQKTAKKAAHVLESWINKNKK